MLNESEHAVPNVTTVEFPIARTVLHVTRHGDTSWALWETKDLVAKAIDPAAGNLARLISILSMPLRAEPDDSSDIIHGPAADEEQDVLT
jgi:hypothetical protein